MSSSSSASSRFSNRRSVKGVPQRCWCGRKLLTYVSQTNENPCRRFYRCEIALQRKLEDHLFKWVDEALLDETRMVEAKHLKLVEDVKQLRNCLMDNMERLKTMVAKIEEEMKERMDEKMKTELMVANATMEKMVREMVKKTIQTMGVAVLLVGGMAWVWWEGSSL